MFGENPGMNTLETRKQLLIAESEINRLQLAEEWQTMAGEARSVVQRAGTLRSFVINATSLIFGMASFRRTKSAPTGEKHSWGRTLLKAARLAGSLWWEISRRP